MVKFGRVVEWFVDEEVTEKSGIVSKMTISLKPEQVEALIEYLSDEDNADQYGFKLDIALWETEEPSETIRSTGSLTPKYKKPTESIKEQTAKKRSGGRRSL